MNSTPFSRQAWTSSSLIGREASEIWVSPLQNASKPSPVPAPSGDPDVRILPVKRFGCPLGDREHGAGALDGYLAGRIATFLRFRAFFLLSPAASATSAAGQDQGQGQEKHPDQQARTHRSTQTFSPL
jgi:hypothetical protein